MLSNLLEGAGFLSLIAGTYELAGRGWALYMLAGCLFVGGLAAENTHPLQAPRRRVNALWRRVKPDIHNARVYREQRPER